MYRIFSRFYPNKIKKSYKELLNYLDIRVRVENFVGFVLISGFLFALALSLFLSAYTRVSVLLLFIGLFVLIEFVVYILLVLKADAKGRFVESILPDVLQLMSSNLRAGLTTDKALLLSARDEFGPFKDELNRVGKEIAMGSELDSSLLKMTKRIKSKKLMKTVLLIVSGLRSGGELASLLDQTAKNLRQSAFVEQKIRSNVMMYVLFIFAAIGFGAPVLFGLSSFLVEVLSENISAIEIPQTVLAESLPLSFSNINISIKFIIQFAIISMITSSVLGSLILGLISKGSEKQGLKFVPILIVLSLTVFFLTRFLIKNMLGGLFGV
jgi:pilus assembly protein TadC